MANRAIDTPEETEEPPSLIVLILVQILAGIYRVLALLQAPPSNEEDTGTPTPPVHRAAPAAACEPRCTSRLAHTVVPTGSMPRHRAADPSTSSVRYPSIGAQVSQQQARGTRWYVVVRGREIGVFEGWNRVAPLVVGVSGSSFHKVRTEAEGWARFEDAETDGQTYVIPP